MTKEELKQKCAERAKIFQQAMESCHSSSPIDCIEWFADRILELEAQIEKMKCCGNCRWEEYSSFCDNCKRLEGQIFADILTGDNWELRK